MKKTISLILSLALVLSFSVALADSRITVSGTGETSISADVAIISLGVSARDRDVLKAQQQVNATIARIRNALIEKGVGETDINTDYMNIYAIYDYSNDQEQLTAYSASSTLAIRVTDIDAVGTLIDVSFEAGANTLNGISFSASSTEKARNESLQKAVADARAKAEILAEEAGLKITGIVSVSEGSTSSYENSVSNFAARASETMGKEEDAGTVVQAAKLIVNATVVITYEAE